MYRWPEVLGIAWLSWMIRNHIIIVKIVLFKMSVRNYLKRIYYIFTRTLLKQLWTPKLAASPIAAQKVKMTARMSKKSKVKEMDPRR